MTHAHHEEAYAKTIFGFWIYLLTDFMLFAAVFAAYAVLRNSTFGGPSGAELFNMPLVFTESYVLLASAFTIGLMGAYAHRGQRGVTFFWLIVSFVLGLIFLGMGYSDLAHMADTGNGIGRSAFTSGYFVLIGMHLFHMLFALMWCIVLAIPMLRFGIGEVEVKRFTCLKMFWQFINIVWVFVLTFVYIVGVK